MDGYDSLITFIDDYSHYGYIYPIKERTEVLDKFKIFKAKVENQHNLKIKIVRSDRGGEYYGRHTPYGQVPRPFARFLQENGKVAHYSIPGEPQQNGVAERRNRTMNGYGAQYDKLLHLIVEHVDGGVKNRHSYS